MPLSGPLSLLNDSVGVVLLACLLAAAVDRVLRVQPSGSATSPESPEPQEVSSRA